MLALKGNDVKHLLAGYLDAVEVCYYEFVDMMLNMFKDEKKDCYEQAAEKIDKLESAADAERHKIIKKMLEGALLPESRRNILEMIELTDEIANKSEDIIRQIVLQNITIHDSIISNILKINDKTKAQLTILFSLMESLLSGYDIEKNYAEIKKIEYIESEVDDLENDAIRKLYRLDISLAEKNQVREIINEIADIADVIEDISDIVEIVMASRRV